MALISSESFEPLRSSRWDAEFYANSYNVFLENMFRRWERWVPIAACALKLTSGHTPRHHDLEVGEVPFITVECVDPLDLNLEKSKRILGRHANGELRRANIVRGDVLITIKRRIANSYPVLFDGPLMVVNQDVALFRPNSDFLPSFVAVVMNSRIGKYQAYRTQTEQINPYLSVTSLGQVLLPQVPFDLQKEVDLVVREHFGQLRRAEEQYPEAENIYFQSIGQSDPHTAHDFCFTSDFASLENGRRLDAEYFSPKYQSLLSLLRAGDYEIGDVARPTTHRFQPREGTSFKYIEISDVADGIAGWEILNAEEAPSRAQWVVEEGDVITSTVRPIRRLSAIIQRDQTGCVCSSGFLALKPMNIEPEVLLVFLRLKSICELFDLYTTASMYPAIPIRELLRIPIRLPCPTNRKRIVKKVQQSIEARRRARELLAAAIDMVEQLLCS
jgi:type I restriction enzyme M protein